MESQSLVGVYPSASDDTISTGSLKVPSFSISYIYTAPYPGYSSGMPHNGDPKIAVTLSPFSSDAISSPQPQPS